MSEEAIERARGLLAKHLRALDGEADAREVERGEWDHGADIKAIVEALATPPVPAGEVGDVVEQLRGLLGFLASHHRRYYTLHTHPC